MTDLELLELAALAAGKDHAWLHRGEIWLCWSGKPHESIDKPWNPLADDGDALRLLNRLPYRSLYVSEIGATVSWRREDGSGHGWKCDEYASEHGGDLNAATRRAIVRAAAEIGKAMP
jgi:hypothetical protein